MSYILPENGLFGSLNARERIVLLEQLRKDITLQMKVQTTRQAILAWFRQMTKCVKSR